MAKKPSKVCYGCKKRSAGCHASCIDYISYRKELDEYNKKVFETKAGENIKATHWSKSTRKRLCGR